MPENNTVWQLWLRVHTQWRVGFNGAVGLDYSVLPIVAGVYGVEITPALFEKIRVLEHYTLSIQEKKKAAD